MNKWLELFAGLILVIAAVLVGFYSQQWGTWNFLSAAWTVLKGGVIWAVLGIGLLLILLGISDLRE